MYLSVQLKGRAMKQIPNQLQYININGEIDTSALVTGVKEELGKSRQQATFLLEKNASFWNELKDEIAKMTDDQEQLEHKKVLAQVLHVEHFLDTWIKTAVQDFATFEMFVMTKAAEIRSGDDKRDYYWALNIRFDQLSALTQVVDLLLQQMERWVGLGSKKTLDDPIWLGLADNSLEDQIYLEAEAIHAGRQHSPYTAA